MADIQAFNVRPLWFYGWYIAVNVKNNTVVDKYVSCDLEVSRSIPGYYWYGWTVNGSPIPGQLTSQFDKAWVGPAGVALYYFHATAWSGLTRSDTYSETVLG